MLGSQLLLLETVFISVLYVTLDHKTSRAQVYFLQNQQNTVWVKSFNFSFMQKYYWDIK